MHLQLNTRKEGITMAPNTREMIGTIAGPFKIIERTNQKDSSKRILYRAECVCSAIELGPLSTLGKFQGHGCSCPGHPLKKGMEKPDSGFTYFPDQPEHADALAVWESARHPDQIMEESEVNTAADTTSTETVTIELAPVVIAEDTTTTTETSTITETASSTEIIAADATVSDVTAATPDVTQESSNAAVNKDTSTKMSAVLAKRLKLVGYHTTSTKLLQPVKILGLDAVNVVFAENAEGDKVLLHICLSSVDGKKSIVSSKKKVAEADWLALSAALTGMKITWREKEQSRVAVAK
jgi:hypothetical protein